VYTQKHALRFSLPHILRKPFQEAPDSDASSLGFANLGGVYLVMFVGSCFGSVYGLVNVVVSVFLSARENKVTRQVLYKYLHLCRD